MRNLCSMVSEGPLITTHWANREFEFYSSDSEEKFLKKSKEFASSDWIYSNKTIAYKFNKQGYRTWEWDHVNWSDSVVVLGCSNVLGEGLAEQDTITSQLSLLLNRPVVNLGVSGTGIAFSAYNSSMLCKNLPVPYAVVQLWSSVSRIELYTHNNIKIHSAANHGHTDSVSKNFYSSWISHPENFNTHMFFNAQMTKLLWQAKTRYYEASFFYDTANVLDCDYISVLDVARDGDHPGIETAKSTALQISKNLS